MYNSKNNGLYVPELGPSGNSFISGLDLKTIPEIKESNVILVQFDLQEYNIDEINIIHQKIQNIYPNNQVLTIPKNLDLSVEGKEAIKEKLQDIINKL